MNPKFTRHISRFFDGMGGWFVLALMLLIFAMAARTPLDSDLWWHLRAGEETLWTGHVLMVDTFSHTRAGEPWVNHSWLSQVGMILLFRWGGYLALGAAVAFLATLSMRLVFAQMDGPPLLRAFVLVLGAVVASVVWSPRPQLVSLVLFGFVGYLIHLFRRRQRDRLWLLVPIFALWSNLHGGYVLGLLLIAAAILGELFDHLGFTGVEALSFRRIGRLALWGLAAALVVVVNPNGVAMWLIPFRTVGVGVLQEFVSEWASPDFHQLVQQPFLWLLLGTLAAVGISGRRMDGVDWVSVAGFAYLALLARRNFAPFAMVAAPVFSRHLWAAWQSRESRRGFFSRRRGEGTQSSTGPLPAQVRWMLNAWIVVLLALAAAFKLYAVTTPDLVAKYRAELFPVKAVQWIRENHPPGQLFNEYHWGGYLTWNLPDYPVFVDGRTDLYDDEILRQYLRVLGDEEGWEKTLNKYGVNLVLVESQSALARELARSAGWRLVHQDDLAVIYLRENR